jgi:O-antigen/teichoic acid export membrane protein
VAASTSEPRGGRTVRAEATSTFAFQIINMIAGAITNIVIARTLGPSGKGVLALLGYGVFVATSLGALGLQAASVYMIGKGRFTKEEIAGGVTAVGLVTGVLGALATWLLLPHFRGTVPLTPLMIGATALVVIPAILRLDLSGIFLGTGRMLAYNLSLTGLSLGWMIGAFVLLVPFRGDTQQAVLLWSGIQIVGSLITLAAVYAKAPPRLRGMWDRLPTLLSFGVRTYAANLVWIMVLRVDTFILAAYRSAGEVGVYSVAVLVAEVVLHLPRSLTLVLTRRFAAGDLLPAARMAARASRLGSMAVLVLGLCLAGLAGPVIPYIFGRGFAASVPPLLWLLPGVVSLSVASPLSLYLVQQRGKPVWTGVSALVALAIDVGLNVLWIPRHGAVGAAWASSVAYTVHAAIISLLFHRETGLGWGYLIVPTRDDFRTWMELISRRRS